MALGEMSAAAAAANPFLVPGCDVQARQQEIDKFCKQQLKGKANAKQAHSLAEKEYATALNQQLAMMEAEEQAEMLSRRARAEKVSELASGSFKDVFIDGMIQGSNLKAMGEEHLWYSL